MCMSGHKQKTVTQTAIFRSHLVARTNLKSHSNLKTLSIASFTHRCCFASYFLIRRKEIRLIFWAVSKELCALSRVVQYQLQLIASWTESLEPTLSYQHCVDSDAIFLNKLSVTFYSATWYNLTVLIKENCKTNMKQHRKLTPQTPHPKPLRLP